MSTTRKRLSPGESRDAALEAARAILLESGPQAVTLKAVASRIGRTHANLLHHFGSAAELQKALAAKIAATVTARIGAAALHARATDQDPREVVALTFDAFDTEGAGALASWMILSGNRDALDPVLEAIRELVNELAEDTTSSRNVHEETLSLVLTALGHALLGRPMSDALGLPPETARAIATRHLRMSLAPCAAPPESAGKA